MEASFTLWPTTFWYALSKVSFTLKRSTCISHFLQSVAKISHYRCLGVSPTQKELLHIYFVNNIKLSTDLDYWDKRMRWRVKNVRWQTGNILDNELKEIVEKCNGGGLVEFTFRWNELKFSSNLVKVHLTRIFVSCLYTFLFDVENWNIIIEPRFKKNKK